MIFIIINIICTLYFFLTSLPTLFSFFGINFPFFLGFLPGIVNLLLLCLCTLWLAIDGFGEKHLVKTLSLITAGILTLYFIVQVLALLNIVIIPLPGIASFGVSLLYFAGGVFLLFGIFLHHMN